MPFKPVPIWKEMPFLRLVIPFIAGIIVQWYLQPPIIVTAIFSACAMLTYILFQFSKRFIQFRLYWLNGAIINLLLLLFGASLTYYADTAHQPDYIGKYYRPENIIIATLQEPLSEKDKSCKALARVDFVGADTSLRRVKGAVLLYFKKDSSLLRLGYGAQIVFKKILQPIKNSGNPGAFDYVRYCSFQGIYHQVFLEPGEFAVVPQKNENLVKKFLLALQEKTLNIFREYVAGNKEKGFAEALLIGYKDDLDKGLVQAYTNTGVVHIIAISGMQLALIYGSLLIAFKPFSKFRVIRAMEPVIVISTLWLFSLMSGASASVLRAAAMLTIVVIGESFSKKKSIYNTLAASAFLLLCYDPFLLWDVGFQLSYFAVLSILIFMKPVYHLFYIQNKILDLIWQLTAVTLSAQVLTTPVSIFYFHQFPNYFLLTNLIAVPLSSLILFGEIFLFATSLIPVIAKIAGGIISKLTSLLNSFIEHMEAMPKSLWDNLQINTWQLMLLYACIIAFAIWFLQKKKNYLFIGLSALLAFVSLRSFSFWQASQQKKIIVFNVPKHQAIDFISGRNDVFKGDAILMEEGFLRNFHLKPSRVMHRVSETGPMPDLKRGYNLFLLGRKRVVVIDQDMPSLEAKTKIKADLIIISKNPLLKIEDLAKIFECRQWVFDASSANWKIENWKNEAARLGLSCHDVAEKGAFVMNAD